MIPIQVQLALAALAAARAFFNWLASRSDCKKKKRQAAHRQLQATREFTRALRRATGEGKTDDVEAQFADLGFKLHVTKLPDDER